MNVDQPSSSRQSFSEELLSGYLDGVLTQADEQRVRILLESSDEYRALYDDMRRLRETTMSTSFRPIEDDLWDEAPRSSVSSLARNLGWAVLAVWFVGVMVLILWMPDFAVDKTLARLMVGGGLGGVALLLVSAALDRWRSSRKDIYREVKK
jgi:predicted anti-sigma-YlaC factor YlaD